MKRGSDNAERPRLEGVFFDAVYWALLAAATAVFTLGYFTDKPMLQLVGSAAMAIGLYAGFVEPYWLRVKTYRLALTEDPTVWMRIAFLSDFHAGAYKRKRFFDRVVSVAASLRPDAVVIGGDAVEERAGFVGELSSLRRLHPRSGKFFVLGNHDFLDDPDAIAGRLNAWGYADLNNVTRMLEYDGRRICFAGLDDPWRGQPRLERLKRGQGVPIILFVHEPDALLDLPEKSADVIVLGHTHGGQVRLPWLGVLWKLPQQAPQWLDVGKKEWRGMPIVISAGLGETGSRVRLFCRPEIVMLEIGW